MRAFKLIDWFPYNLLSQPSTQLTVIEVLKHFDNVVKGIESAEWSTAGIYLVIVRHHIVHF